MPPPEASSHVWFRAGDDVFPAMLDAIYSAQRTVRLETYNFGNDELGRRFQDALVAARRRGVRVQVLVDAFGSQELPSDFWQPLQAAGGEARWFNPYLLKRFGFRDHRKIIVCDEATAFVGGFNIAAPYQGDGIKTGWRDVGLRIDSPLAVDLAAAFDEMFDRAELEHKPFTRLRKSAARKEIDLRVGQLLLSGPGRGPSPFKRFLNRDIPQADRIRIVAAYFLPTWRIRRGLMRRARAGRKVQLILPAKCDVLLSQLAARSLYRRMLKAGIEIYEYQPQILHAKLILIDGAAYVGSSNLDPRSLHLNYELMLRFERGEIAEGAQTVFEEMLPYCQRIELEVWRKSRSWWHKLQQRWAYFILVRIDPLIARWGHK